MKYVVKKVGVLIVMLFLVSFITFIAFSVIPGDSAIASLGTDATEEAVEALRESMGYNDPLPVRYASWLAGALHGDFNVSTQYNVEVKQLLLQKLPVTFGLAVLSLSMIAVVGIPLGLWLAKTRNEHIKRFVTFVTQVMMSVPSFFLGIMLTLVFGILLKWFTPGTYVSYADSIPGFWSCLICPAVTIALPKISMVAKFTASSVNREVRQDYVRTAYSKGSTRNYVFRRHILKNAMMPVITFMGMIVADTLAGCVLVEQVFNLPGIGRLLVVSIGNRDLYVVQAIILYIVSVVVLVNFLVDILYQRIDPRVRL